MKINHLFNLLTVATGMLALAAVTSCDNNGGSEAKPVDTAVLTTQAEVDAFAKQARMTSLTIKGEDITDISNLDVTSVDELVIKGTSIEEINTTTFASVNTKFEISDNSKLTAISGLGLKFCTADIIISGNAVLENIKGFMGIKTMSGNFNISGNPMLGEDDGDAPEDYGFNVLKYLVDNQVLSFSQITLSNNHPGAATDPTMIGLMQGGYPTYTIRSIGDVAEISKTECQDLILLGADVDDDVWGAINLTGLKVVHGNLYAEGCSFTMLGNVLANKSGEGLIVEGGFTFKNFVAFQQNDINAFLNTDNFPTHVGGDVILEKMMLHGWPGAGLNSVTEVDGDIVVKECTYDPNIAWGVCTKVHGSVTFDNLLPGHNSGNMGPWNIEVGFEEIDGDLSITNNGWFVNFQGWNKVKKIGGNLLVKGNTKTAYEGGFVGGIDPIEAATGLGFDFIQNWIWNGVVAYDKVECYDVLDNKVEFTASK
ncbi:MAG: hypothetical protein MJY56_00600 [Bacteroidales bacterium]|nr:hypothetical protein [Bacteroidales bacterium]